MAYYTNVPPAEVKSPMSGPKPGERHAFEGLHGGRCEYRSEDNDERCGRVSGDKRHLGYTPQFMQPPSIAKAWQLGPGSIVGAKDEEFWPGSAMSVWQGHSDAVLALLKKKSEAYGNAWVEQGYMGNLARVFSKASRLRNMLWSDTPPDLRMPGIEEQGKDVESVLDTLYDLSALCALAIANIEEENRWGK